MKNLFYLDSSVLLSFLFNQKGGLDLTKFNPVYSSRLIKTECLRCIYRMNATGLISENEMLNKQEELEKLLKPVGLVEVSESILRQAEINFGKVIKTLDAIHLATAMILRNHFNCEVVFITNDEQLKLLARSQNFSYRD